MKRSIAGWMAGVLLMAGAALAEGASVTIQRMQQRYPWNGLVDIDYTVAGVPEGQEANYYVRFKLKRNGRTFVLHDFLDDSKLVDAVNGSYRVTWDSAAEKGDEYHFLANPVGLQAELVYCTNGKANSPYAIEYLIIDLSAGAAATSYPVETRRIATQEAANAMFNTDEYKTTKLVLRKVRAGSFMMGSPTDEYGREQVAGRDASLWHYETRHPVTLTESFYLGIFEVTQAQYYRVTGTNPSTLNINNDACPVNAVFYWQLRGNNLGFTLPLDFGKVDGYSFMGLLASKTGLTFDLPTEAQWEYACRAGTETATYGGDFGQSSAGSVLGAIAQYNGIEPRLGGGKAPNPWGFYDMLGNHWEICRDWVPYSGTQKENFGYEVGVTEIPAQTDPISNVPGGRCIARGGSAYDKDPGYFRAAFRLGIIDPAQSTKGDSSMGFRVSGMRP